MAKKKSKKVEPIFRHLPPSIRVECDCCKGAGVLNCASSCHTKGAGSHMHVCETCSGDGMIRKYMAADTLPGSY